MGWVCLVCEETVEGRRMSFLEHVQVTHPGEVSVVGIEEDMMVDLDGVQTLAELRERLLAQWGSEGVL